VAGNAIWALIQHLASVHVPYFRIAAIFQLLYFVLIALIGVFIGRGLERGVFVAPTDGGVVRPKMRQSQTFVLEVEGTQPLDSAGSDWKFFLTNCTTRILRTVQVSDTRSEIGAYDLCFNEIPVMQPGQKVKLSYQVFPRRDSEKHGSERKTSTLWDFGIDHANIRGNTFIWYDIPIVYRDGDEASFRDAGVVAVCFDLSHKILKTEGAEIYRKDRERWNSDFN
jgi:hypothetical protein